MSAEDSLMAATLEGSMAALVTPFTEGGAEVDVAVLTALVDWQIASGTDAIIPCGTTGESATLSHDEHNAVVEETVKAASGRVPVIAGTGSNSTTEAIELTKHAEEVGADAALLVAPYYIKPEQAGLIEHYTAIAEATTIPLILYNVPGRTVTDILPETVVRLAEHPRIVGIKEATGSMRVASEILAKRPDFLVLSGDDFSNVSLWALGARGAISVTANVAPALMAQCWDAWAAGDAKKARDLHHTLLPLHCALFLETNPLPVKKAVHLLGKCADEIRLPLTRLSPAHTKTLHAAMAALKLL